MRLGLPIGIQDFRKIRENNYLYVDKTEDIFRMIRFAPYFFLSRPRRFGKSLTLSTIKELFLGSRELFKGLWIEPHWDWTQKNPVIHIHFEAMGYKKKGLEGAISDFLEDTAREHDITLKETYSDSRLRELIKSPTPINIEVIQKSSLA